MVANTIAVMARIKVLGSVSDIMEVTVFPLWNERRRYGALTAIALDELSPIVAATEYVALSK
jgi:hypothetical protein